MVKYYPVFYLTDDWTLLDKETSFIWFDLILFRNAYDFDSVGRPVHIYELILLYSLLAVLQFVSSKGDFMWTL